MSRKTDPITPSDVTVNDTLLSLVRQFINQAANGVVMKVGHGLDSETQEVSYCIVADPLNPHDRYFLVDTPGFNEANVDDQEILGRIVRWLKQCTCRMKLIVLYFVEAGNNDDPSAPFGPLAVSLSLGSAMAASFHIAISNTSEKESNTDVQEKKLRKKFAIVHRFTNSYDSAWAILRESGLPLVDVSSLADALSSQKSRTPAVKQGGLMSRLFKGW
ncbi:hypothetical protein H0H92_008955 [Tricholoma furcatifolium]|nr:hypothetical protein H0H92_008955 [Tricholoma furcatifolium]